jgi:hypothetical protein
MLPGMGPTSCEMRVKMSIIEKKQSHDKFVKFVDNAAEKKRSKNFDSFKMDELIKRPAKFELFLCKDLLLSTFA